MSELLQSLIWKEWRERHLALAIGTLWMLGAAIYAWVYAAGLNIRAPIASYFGSSLLFSVFVPILLAMRTAAGERSRGTLSFTRALPTSIRQIALTRLAGGIACLAVPIVIGSILLTVPLAAGSLEQAQRRPAGPWDGQDRLPSRPSMAAPEAVGLLWMTTTISVSSGATLFVFLSLLGNWSRTESQIGFTGAVIACLWTLAMSLGPATRDSRWWGWTAAVVPHSIATSYGYQELDGTGYADLDVARTVWGPLAVNLLLIATVALLFARGYGQLRASDVSAPLRWWRRVHGPQLLSRIRFRWPGRLPALIWLDLRQSIPMCLAGLAMAIAMGVAELSEDRLTNAVPGVPMEWSLRSDAELLAAHLPGSMWIVALIWGAIVGAGVFSGEPSPRLGQFWRSRPISPGMWFWTKYVVGLVTVLSVLDLTTIAVSWGAPAPNSMDGMNWSYIYCVPLLHAASFSIAAACVCWTRRPVIAAAVAIGLFMMTDVVMTIPPLHELTPLAVHNSMLIGDGRTTGEIHGAFNPTAHGYWATYSVVAGVVILATLCAWRGALREEIQFDGWRRRIRSSAP